MSQARSEFLCHGISISAAVNDSAASVRYVPRLAGRAENYENAAKREGWGEKFNDSDVFRNIFAVARYVQDPDLNTDTAASLHRPPWDPHATPMRPLCDPPAKRTIWLIGLGILAALFSRD